jgi:hypothetical protein
LGAKIDLKVIRVRCFKLAALSLILLSVLVLTGTSATAVVNPNDYDGDGILNSVDIDDDNDGILDTVESPPCQYDISKLTFNNGAIASKTSSTITTSTGGWKTSYSDQTFTGPIHLEFKADLTGTVMMGLFPTTGTQTPTSFQDGGYKFYPLNSTIYGYFGGLWNYTGTHNAANLYSIDIDASGYLIARVNGAIVYQQQKQNVPYRLSVSSNNGQELTDIKLTDGSMVGSCGDIDTDGDGIINRFDLDSDNDTIPDNNEAQTTAGYIAPGIFTDLNGDGMNDIYYNNGAGLIPIDTDGDGAKDYLDLNSDNEGKYDIAEAGRAIADTDGDGRTNNPVGENGLDNIYELVDTYIDVNGSTNNTSSLPNVQNASTPEVDFRDNDPDADGDGIPDRLDLDDDNDGILDTTESAITCTSVTSTGMTNYRYWRGGPTTGWHDAVPISGGGGTYAQNWLTGVDGYGLPLNTGSPFSTGTVAGISQPSGTDSTTMTDVVRWDGWVNFPSSLYGQTIYLRVTTPASVGAGAWVISRDANPSNWIDPVDPITGTPLLDMTNTTGYHNPVQGWNQPPFGYSDYAQYEGAGGAQSSTGGGGGAAIPPPRGTPSAFQARIVVSPYGHYFAEWEVDPVNNWAARSLQYSINGTSWINVQNSDFGTTNPCSAAQVDTDGDGIPDHLDLDSDNDGISDLIESGQPASRDANNDGVVDGAISNSSSTLGVPIASGAGQNPVNTDGDSRPDYLDLDSDGDGIPDTVESRLTAGYIANDGDVRNNDADGDGVVSLSGSTFDGNSIFGGMFTSPVDTDGDGTPDYKDLDSDADDKTDKLESGLNLSNVDVNGDGIDDGVGASYQDPDGIVNNPSTALSNELGDNTEVAYREKLVPISSFTLTKDSSYQDTNGNSKVDVGDRVLYTFVITNTGNTTLTNITISDTNAAISGGPITSLAPTAIDTTTFTGTHNLTQEDIDAGKVDNTATATATKPDNSTFTTNSTDPTPTDPSSPQTTTQELIRAPDMTIRKRAIFNDEINSNGGLDVGETVAYTYIVQNTGNTTLYDINVSESASNFSGLGGLPSPAYLIGGADLDSEADGYDLVPGNTLYFSATYTIVSGDVVIGYINNRATATALDSSDVSLTKDSVDYFSGGAITSIPLDPHPEITTLKNSSYQDTNGNGKADVGDKIIYTYSLVNSGNTNVYDASIAENSSDFTGTGSIPSPVYVSGGADLDGEADGPDLIHSQLAIFRSEYLITQADIDAGIVHNRASGGALDPNNNLMMDLSSDPTPFDPDTPEITSQPLTQTPASDLTKEGTYQDTNSNSKVDVGDKLLYTFTVRNTGNVTLTNITVTDPKVTVSGGPIASLLPTAVDSSTFTAEYALTQADIDAGKVDNTSSAEATRPDNTKLNVESTDPTPTDVTQPKVTTVDLSQAPQLTANKSAVFNDANNNGQLDVGETIDYTYTTKNTGNTTVYDIQVIEDGTNFSGAGMLPTPSY